MSKKASETPEVPSYIPPASEKEKIIEKIRKKELNANRMVPGFQYSTQMTRK